MNLDLLLEGKSDFHLKHGGLKEELPSMMFNEDDCDLYDNVRPIKWTDSTKVSTGARFTLSRLITILSWSGEALGALSLLPAP